MSISKRDLKLCDFEWDRSAVGRLRSNSLFAEGARPEVSDHEAVRFEIAIAHDRRILRR